LERILAVGFWCGGNMVAMGGELIPSINQKKSKCGTMRKVKSLVFVENHVKKFGGEYPDSENSDFWNWGRHPPCPAESGESRD